MQQYITIKELQDKLKIGRCTALELVHSKGFPSVKVGSQWRIGERDLEKWLEKGG